MNAGTAAELKAYEAMGKKDHAGIQFFCAPCNTARARAHTPRPAGAAEQWKHSQLHFSSARSHMAEGEDSDSAAVRLLPLQLQQPATLTLPL